MSCATYENMEDVRYLSSSRDRYWEIEDIEYVEYDHISSGELTVILVGKKWADPDSEAVKIRLVMTREGRWRTRYGFVSLDTIQKITGIPSPFFEGWSLA